MSHVFSSKLRLDACSGSRLSAGKSHFRVWKDENGVRVQCPNCGKEMRGVYSAGGELVIPHHVRTNPAK